MNSKEIFSNIGLQVIWDFVKDYLDHEDYMIIDNQLKQIDKELEKLKKVIEILKEYGDIDLWKGISGRHYLRECGYDKWITQEEYKLLKEVFENEDM